VGGGLPIAVGGAFAAQVLDQQRVAVGFFGDGAVAEGAFHESLNLAALWRLPVVFVCEHNGYAEMTPSTVHLSTTTVADYARPHGIPAETVDGNDALQVREAADRAVQRARAGEGPTLLECRTYRIRGHFEGDPARYRDADEVDAWRRLDPLRLLRDHVAVDSVLSTQLDEADRQCRAEIDAAIAWARTQPEPSPADLTQHVYRRPPLDAEAVR
jgi:TPP-dependent pyruvate/acetoin dehydrogenase alpha subunit